MGSEVEMETDDPKELYLDPKLRAVAARPRWSKAQAERIVSAQHHSGLSVQKFAELLGVKSWRLYKWRRLLGLVKEPSATSPKKPAPPVDLVPLHLAPQKPLAGPSAPPRLEIRHPCGLRIRFSHPPPESFFQHLLQILVPLC
jgi:transposase-like protein